MGRRSRAAGVVIALAAVLPVSACGGSTPETPVAGVVSQNDDGLHGTSIDPPYRLPDVTLTDTADKPYRLASDSTKPLTLVFFGYTNCPDICQTVMADIASAVTRLSPQDRAKVGMVFVTSDPARDTPATLRRYLDRYDPSFEGLTGHLSTIVKAAQAGGIAIEKGPRLPSGGYEVTHGTPVLGMRPSGAVPVVWTGGTPAQQIAEDITTLLHDTAATGGAS